jgi:hypothetical protein
MIREQEPFYGVISRTIAPFGIVRHVAFLLMLPGGIWAVLGMVTIRINWVAGGVAMVASFLALAASFCRSNPHFFSDVFEALGAPRYFVPDSGLRGKDGV